MSRGPQNQALWSISAIVPRETEDQLTDFLQERFESSVTSYTDFESGHTTLTLFLTARELWNNNVAKELARHWATAYPTSAAFPKFRVTRLLKRDWADAWKKHFKPIHLGTRLLVKPPWIRQKLSKGCKVVVLEPGLSFGTGQHPTTLFCLREIVRFAKNHPGGSFLDIGTGSGILAIAAAKLGYRPVEAFDNDPESIRVARTNAARNNVAAKMSLAVRDLNELPRHGSFDLVCANLISNLLIDQKKRIIAQLKPGGILVLAGILASEFSAVQASYESAGLKLLRSQIGKEWRSGSFLQKASPTASVAAQDC